MAKWIWNDLDISKDDYAVFKSSFNSDTNKVTLKICADTNYMVLCNNKLVAFDQYPCYPDHPVYDELPIKCKIGENEIKIIVYYNGENGFSTYAYSGQPGLYFEVKKDDKVLLESNEKILSTRFLAFENGHCSRITNQQGFRAFYDATKLNKIKDYRPSIVVNKSTNFRPRENLKIKLFPHVEGEIKRLGPGHLLIDFKKETTGYLDLDFISPKKQKIIIAWGEHIIDGGVRYLIEERNFSTEFIAKRGRNKHFYTLQRYGLRYLEVFCKEDIIINKFGLRPVYYPFKERKAKFKDPLHQKIYDVSVLTLKSCYHDHFEDCPWREQAFYLMDSRNQMLFHNVAFKNSETIRSCLKLVSEEKRDDHLFGITFPNSFNFTIPSYVLYYPEACYLYATLYKDTSLLTEVYDRNKEMINAFIKLIDKHGVLQNPIGPDYWNFYEWVPGLDYPNENVKSDVILNSLMIIALSFTDKINKLLGKPEEYAELIKKIKKGAKKEFYDKETGLFIFSKGNPKYYCLANSFACLAGIASKKEAIHIGEELIHNKEIIPSSISLRVFMYDLLIKNNKAKYKDYILNDIDTTFKKQLDEDATTFWETEEGAADFNGAGSLCHAWCALAIYYYKKLGVK